MSGRVKALVPISGLLLFSVNSVGLDRAGNFARALDGNDGDPPTVPDRLKADGDWWKFVVAEGLICQVLGGTGGVSGPNADVRRLPVEFVGGVPIANCTLGGDIELMSQLQLLLRRFDCFMLMGWERGIPLDAAAVLFGGDWSLEILRDDGTGLGSEIGSELGRVGLELDGCLLYFLS
jgi:hypothetical protein